MFYLNWITNDFRFICNETRCINDCYETDPMFSITMKTGKINLDLMQNGGGGKYNNYWLMKKSVE